jgi:hypothetical protein
MEWPDFRGGNWPDIEHFFDCLDVQGGKLYVPRSKQSSFGLNDYSGPLSSIEHYLGPRSGSHLRMHLSSFLAVLSRLVYIIPFLKGVSPLARIEN